MRIFVRMLSTEEDKSKEMWKNMTGDAAADVHLHQQMLMAFANYTYGTYLADDSYCQPSNLS